MLTPAGAAAAPKKSKILLLLIWLLTLALAPALPRPITPLVGSAACETGPILLFEIVLLLLPPATVLVLKNTLPPAVAAAAVDAPRMVQRVTVLLEAPLIKRIVLVLAVAEAVVLDSVNEFPPLLSPSMVTLVTPARLTSGLPAVVAPLTVRAPVGIMVSEFQLDVGALRPAVAVPSSVLPTMLTKTLVPVWVGLAFNAANASVS